MRASVCCVALLLFGCDGMRKARTTNEIQTIAHDEAVNVTKGALSDVDDNTEDLQNNVEQQGSDIEELDAENKNLAKRVSELEAHDRKVRDRLHM